MSTSIPELADDNIKHCLLIDLTIDNTTYYISNAFKALTYNSNDYTECGAFLQVTEFTQDIKTTNGDITLSLSGIPSEIDYIQTILSAKITGGTCKIYRSFFDSSYTVTNVYERFSGIIPTFETPDNDNLLEGRPTNTVRT